MTLKFSVALCVFLAAAPVAFFTVAVVTLLDRSLLWLMYVTGLNFLGSAALTHVITEKLFKRWSR